MTDIELIELTGYIQCVMKKYLPGDPLPLVIHTVTETVFAGRKNEMFKYKGKVTANWSLTNQDLLYAFKTYVKMRELDQQAYKSLA